VWSFSSSVSRVAGRLAVADVGVDFRRELAADDHRVERVVVDVRRNDGLPLGDLLADERRIAVLSFGDAFHLGVTVPSRAA